MWKPDTIVMGPCGIKGCMLLGALKALESGNVLKEINMYVGVSSGAIISMFMAAGISIESIICMAVENDLLRDSVDVKFDRIREQKGLISTDAIRRILEPPLVEKFAKVPSFEELYRTTGKSLVTVSFNVNKMESRYFSKETYPRLSVVDAVIMSISIPYLFQQTKFEGDVYVDGACGDNYPISFVDKGDRRILGMRVFSIPNVEINPLELFPRLFNHMSAELAHFRSLGSSANVKHLVLKTEINSKLAVSAEKDDKMKMLRSGYDQGTIFLSILNGISPPIIVDPSDLPAPPES